jgi:hypothetical protein
LGGIVREWPCHVTSEERGPTRVSPSSLIVPASAFHRSQCSRCAAERPKKPTDKESAISLSVAALLRSMAFCGFRVRVMTHYGTLDKTGRACIWRCGQFFKKRRLFANYPTREKRAIFVTSPRRSRCTAGAVSASYVESRAAHHGPVVGSQERGDRRNRGDACELSDAYAEPPDSGRDQGHGGRRRDGRNRRVTIAVNDVLAQFNVRVERQPTAQQAIRELPRGANPPALAFLGRDKTLLRLNFLDVGRSIERWRQRLAGLPRPA